MKKITLVIFVILFIAKPSFSQYCNLAGQTPYSNLQPGITNFKLNTINRTSGNSESASSVVVTTGLTTTVTAGQTYTISMTHSEDTNFFPGDRNNLRVWIDYNSNFSYTDPNETVLSVDFEPPATTYTSTFVVPLATIAGTYHVRATAKMSSDAGHTIPTPCNNPADPIGYHGEMEDYTIVVEAGASQSPVSSFLMPSTLCAKAAVTVTNTSTGTPTPSYSWVATPSAGVTFTPNNTSINPKITFTTSGSYTITCVATNSVSSNSVNKVIAVSNCTFVGISEAGLEDQILIGPNPVADVLNIRVRNEMRISDVSITNYLGQLVFWSKELTSPEGTISMDLSGLNNGIYFLNINSDGKNIHRQVIIQK